MTKTNQFQQLWDKGEREEAVKQLAAYLQHNEHDLPAYLQLSTYLTALKDFPQAEELLQRALSVFPNDASLRYNLGTLYYVAQDYTKAIPIFQELVQNEQMADAQYMLGEIYFRQKQYQLALAFALTAQQADPTAIDANQLCGAIWMSMGNFAEAAQYYRNVLDQAPENVQANFQYGLTQFAQRQPAEKYFNFVQKQAPDYFKQQKQQLTDIERFLDATKDDHQDE
ncbi:tetratricopeptide repeat family protein [Lactobacillus selangorensis]|uniref:Tetratricopeptide repeat family protein n=1 Tax=Lactobacillus selangorensis TaxID=81857 RepID=A0A0R2FWT6_9LACO|nr:tetratricopeptide repeat protein [Lactobacillus selangorensis]KRN29380.1 tetratricopeptide repeat family protein [Lactobacillus selangorensis]KRN34091.1 tetratricopeptide repeat family protein [Lactobacillus selangorensis]